MLQEVYHQYKYSQQSYRSGLSYRRFLGGMAVSGLCT